MNNHMGVDVRKPVNLLWRTTKAQTSQPAPLLFPDWNVSYQNLLQAKVPYSRWLVSVAEQAGLGMTWSDSLKTGFLALPPI